MDDSSMFQVEIKDFIRRPDGSAGMRDSGKAPATATDDEDSLGAARGVLVGLACAVPLWVLVLLLVL